MLLALRDDEANGRRRDAVELAVSAGGLMLSLAMAGDSFILTNSLIN